MNPSKTLLAGALALAIPLVPTAARAQIAEPPAPWQPYGAESYPPDYRGYPPPDGYRGYPPPNDYRGYPPSTDYRGYPRQPYSERERARSARLRPYELDALVSTLAYERSDRDRVARLADASAGRTFRVAEVDRILDPFRTDRGRLQALRVLSGRIVDPRNAELVVQRFDPAWRAEARELLTR